LSEIAAKEKKYYKFVLYNFRNAAKTITENEKKQVTQTGTAV
jgi:hypothetical protein